MQSATLARAGTCFRHDTSTEPDLQNEVQKTLAPFFGIALFCYVIDSVIVILMLGHQSKLRVVFSSVADSDFRNGEHSIL